MLQPSQDKNKRQISEEAARLVAEWKGTIQQIPEGVTVWKEGNPSAFVISGKKDVQGDD